MNSIPEIRYHQGCTFFLPTDHSLKILESMAKSEEDDDEVQMVRELWEKMHTDPGKETAQCLGAKL